MALEVFLFISAAQKTSSHTFEVYFPNFRAFFCHFHATVFFFTQLLQIGCGVSTLAVSLVYYFRIFPDYLGNPQDLHTAAILRYYKAIQSECLFSFFDHLFAV